MLDEIKQMKIMKKVKYWGNNSKKTKTTNFLDKSCLSNYTLTTLGEKKQVTIPQFLLRGGGVGIFLFKLSNKTWKIFHLFSPRQRYLWNIYNAFCKNVLGENPQRETLLRRFNKIDPESALRKSFVLAAEILWTSKTFDWYFSSATWLLRKIIRVQLQMHLKAKLNTSEQFILSKIIHSFPCFLRYPGRTKQSCGKNWIWHHWLII